MNIRKWLMTALAIGSLSMMVLRPAQAALSAGDIAIIGLNSDNPDEISFVALADIAASEVIHFTDKGWTATGSLRSYEGTHDYTVPAGGLSAGQIVVLQLSGPELSTDGDQVLAYQGDADSPIFIYAVNMEGNAVWQADAIDSYTSALPLGLVNGTTAVALPEFDNAAFNTATLASGTKAEWLAAIGNVDNWTLSNNRLGLPSGMITTSSGVDLRAYQAADGVYVEFVAYDVEADGEIELALMGENGEALWLDSVEVTAGPQSIARFLVPGLERGQSYNFLVRDEVGKWWEADGVTVASFASEMTEMTLSGLTITFDSLPDHSYSIQWCARLGGEWQAVTNVIAVAGRTSIVVAYPEGGADGGFFRVQAE